MGVTAEELVKTLTTTYDVAVLAALIEISTGAPPLDVLQALFELAQKRVTEDPQAYGLVGTPC